MIRGIRGATTADHNTKEAIVEASHEMLAELIEANEIDPDYIAAAIFSTTSDLNAEFPAVALRQMGWTQVPLMCGQEMPVPGDPHRCIRAMVLVNTEKRPEELKHIYLRGAVNLRRRGME